MSGVKATRKAAGRRGRPRRDTFFRLLDPGRLSRPEFRGLEAPGRAVFFYLFAHQHMTSMGVLMSTLDGLMAEVGQSPADMLHADPGWMEEGFRELLRKGFLHRSERVPVIVFPEFFMHNFPQNPNWIRGWRRPVAGLPECALLDEYFQALAHVVERLGKGFAEGLPERFREGIGKGCGRVLSIKYRVFLNSLGARGEDEELGSGEADRGERTEGETGRKDCGMEDEEKLRQELETEEGRLGKGDTAGVRMDAWRRWRRHWEMTGSGPMPTTTAIEHVRTLAELGPWDAVRVVKETIAAGGKLRRLLTVEEIQSGGRYAAARGGR